MTPTVDDLATAINCEHDACGRAASDALAHARRAGELLAEVKKQLLHGDWLPWLAEHCPTISTRTAQAYMRVAAHWPELEANTQRVAHLPFRQALALLAEEPAKRERVSSAPPVPEVFWKQLTREQQSEVRRIAEEMAEFPFTRHTFIEQRGCGSTQEVLPGCPGAPVYWDILGGDPKSGEPNFKYSRGEVCARLYAFIDGGPRSRVSDLAVVVAQRRLAGDRRLSRPLLPPFIGDGNVVSLSTETYSQCIFLAQQFKTGALEATIAKAVAFAHFSYSATLDEEEIEAFA